MRLLLCSLALCLGLAACGDNDAGGPVVGPTATPTSAPAATATPTPAPTPAPVRRGYIALGDSLVAGIGASDPRSKGFVGLVDAHYRSMHRDAPAVINLGMGGETSASFALGQWPRAAGLLGANPSIGLVTLTIGANDYLPLLESNPCPDKRDAQALTCALGAFRGALPNHQQFLSTTVAPERPGSTAAHRWGLEPRHSVHVVHQGAHAA